MIFVIMTPRSQYAGTIFGKNMLPASSGQNEYKITEKGKELVQDGSGQKSNEWGEA
jgi:predicted transcriptional regulator